MRDCVLMKVRLEEAEDDWLQRDAISDGQSVLGASTREEGLTLSPDFINTRRSLLCFLTR